MWGGRNVSLERAAGSSGVQRAVEERETDKMKVTSHWLGGNKWGEVDKKTRGLKRNLKWQLPDQIYGVFSYPSIRPLPV